MSDSRPASDSATTTYSAIPPKKIACGFYHSVAISNVKLELHHDDKGERDRRNEHPLEVDEHKAYCWGSNRFNTLGFTFEQRKRLHHEKIEEEKQRAKAAAEAAKKSILVSDLKTRRSMKGDAAKRTGGAGHHATHSPSFENSSHSPRHSEDAGDSPTRSQASETDAKETYLDDALQPACVEDLADHVCYEVGAGVSHTIFLVQSSRSQSGGTLYATGLGTRGRLGVPNPDATGPPDYQAEETWYAKQPMRVKFGLPRSIHVLRVDCGADHTLCYLTNGRLYSFGADLWGQCGVGNFNATIGNVYEPMEVLLPKGEAVVHFTAGAQHSFAIVGKNRELWAWGCGRNGRLGLGNTEEHCFPQPVVGSSELHLATVDAGEAHSGAIDIDGHVLTWGKGSCGRLGLEDQDDALVPTRVAYFDNIGGGSRVKIEAIALGGFHTLFSQECTRGSQLYVCGTGIATGLGTGEKGSVGYPVPIMPAASLLRLQKITQIAAGMYHSLVLFKNGALASWGIGACGRIGTNCEKNVDFLQELQFKGFSLVGGSTLFSAVELEKQEQHAEVQDERSEWELTHLACGSAHTMGLTRGGHVYAWGCNDCGQLGLAGSVQYAWAPDMLTIPSRKIRQIAVGYEHCLAITNMMELYCWGKGTDGQLGLGHAHNISAPQMVESLTDVVAISAGEVHSAAIVRQAASNVLFAWGSAEGGILGAGSEYVSGINTEPLRVDFKREPARARSAAAALSPIAVRCGQSHTAAILGLPDGPGNLNELWTFGNGAYGKLGLGTSDNAYSPQSVSFQGPTPADVALGAYHTVMLSQDGTIHIWGHHSMVCSSEDVQRPVKFTHIEGNPTVKAIACGEMHTLVVTKDRKLYSWGSNKCGQLGLGMGFSDVGNPDLVSLAAPVELIAAGTSHSVIGLANQQVFAFGNQSLGRLGLHRKARDKYVWEPTQVDAPWTTMDSMRHSAPAASPAQEGKAAEEGATADGAAKSAAEAKGAQGGAGAQAAGKEGGDNVGSASNVTSLPALQSLIRNQDPQCQSAQLARLEKELEERFLELFKDVRELRETEKGLDKLENEFEQSFCNNLHWIKVSEPVVDATTEDPELIVRIPIYQQMLWLLQNQTSYLAMLSCCITGPNEIELFHRVMERLFANPSERTRHLLQMATRLMLSEEINQGRKLRDLFNPKKGSLPFEVFSRQVLSVSRARDIVHLYMKVDKHAEHKTLLHRVIEVTDRNIFALSFEDYRDGLGEEEKKNKDDTELKTAFGYSLDALYQFVTEIFPDSIMRYNLPHDIRQLFCHVLRELRLRKIEVADAGESTVPPELRVYEPLLRLFCQGLLVPLLRDPQRFASKEYFLKVSTSELNSTVVANAGVVASFLELMVEGKLGQCQKILQSAEKVLLPLLLRWVSTQTDVSDDLETRLVVDTYTAQYRREQDIVTFVAGDLMKLSNMLSAQMLKLRMREDDDLEALCKQLPEWSDDKILLATSFEVLHNFSLDTRFLLNDTEPPGLCQVSKSVLPRRYCSGKSSLSILKCHKERDAEDPGRKIEALLGKLEPMQCKNWPELRDEFKKAKNYLEQSATPAYRLCHDLKEGMRVVDTLIEEDVRMQDMVDRMMVALVERERHLHYLLDLKHGITLIQQQRELHWSNMKRWRAEVQGALKASLELKLPQPFLKHSGTNRLKFETIRGMMKLTQAYNAAEMKELGAELIPTAEFTIKQLRTKKVIVDINPKFAPMEKQMRVNFKPSSGGVDLVVKIVQGKLQNTVTTLVISNATLEEFQRAGKTETAPLCNPGEPAFLTCMCADFAAMVSRLKAQK